jgi:hypothetical protein
MPGWLSLRAAACGALLLSAAPSFAAPEPQAVADQLVAAVAASGEGALTYQSVTGSGDAVALSGIKLTAADGTVNTAPSLAITGLADRPAGGYTATRITFDHGTTVGHGDTITWQGGALDDVIIPTAEEVKTRQHVRLFRAISFTNLNISGGDVSAPVDAATFSLDVGEMAQGSPTNIVLRATGVRLPAALLTNSVASALISMLDYKEFVADISMDGEYDSGTNTVTCRALVVDVPAVGRITVSGRASGVSLRDVADRAKTKEARAKTRLDTMTVRIENAGFVERMLDMQAQMLGGTRDDVRSQLVDGALPFALSFVENETFRTEALVALSAFLADPRSLTITFAPAEPVPLGQAIRTAARRPGALPDLLAPRMQANN